jgi:DNA repair protein RecO (recombination protein O)
MHQYRDTGVVLRTYNLGEADRIVVLLTAEHGKVRAVAKGIRKTKSRFGGRLEPLSHVALLVREGRSLDLIQQVETLDHFRVVREDLDRLTRGASLLEVCDQLAQEREPAARLYQMLVGALRSLATNPSPLLVPGFQLKVLAAEGVEPQVDVCVSCGSAGPLVAFDAGEGGALCRSCRRGVAVSAEALELVRMVLGGRLAAALAAPAAAATHEVELLAARAMEHHLERRLRSTGLLT